MLDETFWKFVFPVTECGCWIWMGCLNYTTHGYGQYTKRNVGLKTKLAHRLAYEDKFGPIPKGMFLDHLCRVPECVNPDHLRVVTNAENVRIGRKWNREKTHCAKGHPFNEANTRHSISRGWKCRACRACQRLRNKKRKTL